MRKYRHIKSGRIVTTTCAVQGDMWEEILPEQAPDQTEEVETETEQAPAKPAKKGKK